MACGCSGSKRPAAARTAAAPAEKKRGPGSPGYYFTGPQKRAAQDSAKQR